MRILGALKKNKEPEQKQDPREDTGRPGRVSAEPEKKGGDDLAVLLRKINAQQQAASLPETPDMSRNAGAPSDDAGEPPAPAPRSPPAVTEDDFFLETEPPKDETPARKPAGQPDAREVRDSLAKIMADIGSRRQAPVAPPSPASGETGGSRGVAAGAGPAKPAGTSPPSPAASPKVIVEEVPVQSDGTAAGDERIISVDQLSDLSGLILPKSATFKIEELKLHGRVNIFEGKGTGVLPPEINEIWQREFSTAGFKDLDLETDIIKEKKTRIIPAKKIGLAGLFKVIRHETEEYNPKVHGPIVDLAFDAKPGLEEIEVYPVNEPYAYVRIIYDHATHEYTYQVVEPILTEPEKDLLKELKERLFETLDINTKDISKDEARIKLRTAADEILNDYGIRLTPVQREKILYNMHKDFLGDGLIDAIMHDKYIEDISCDGVNSQIFAYHSSYESMRTTLTYHNAEELDSFVTKLAQRAGKYISIAEPILDATMGDGSRIQMTLGQEVTAHGSTFTIRKFKDEPITPTDLIEWHTFAPLSIAYIWLCVENGKSAIFAGGTASGKTTSLNAIALFIPPMSKIVSLEDTREIKLPHPNWIPSVTRDSFDAAGRGELNMYELPRAATRQRPELTIVG